MRLGLEEDLRGELEDARIPSGSNLAKVTVGIGAAYVR